MGITRRGAVTLLVLGLILGLGFLVYAPALGGALLLDDMGNLSGLAQVHDLRSALMFIFSGEAGPLGRPIALASFALQADAWSTAKPFLLVNIMIHLLNGGLLGWVTWRIATSAGLPEEQRGFVTVSTVAVWLFMPLLASSSLMVVQRMTTLSATFVLAALGTYLHAREAMEQSPLRSYAGMSLSLVLGTVLAILAKESGALLPVYVLALEMTLLPHPAAAGRGWRPWKLVFLVLPAAAILVYLLTCLPYSEALTLRRDFTGLERLLTEARILWQYLFLAFLPQPGAFGPFHDGYAPVRQIANPVTLAAIAAWAGLLIAALAGRRRYPLFAFAVLWFIGGHLLESTVVSLELYFEHRNYLPLIGPIFVLCAMLGKAAAVQRKLVYAGTSAYVLVNALVLFGYTTLWGKPAEAAEYWESRFPDSVRAATHATRYRLAGGNIHGALQALHALAERSPAAGYVLIPALSISCMAAPDADHDREVARVSALLREASFSFTTANMLSQLLTTVSAAPCNGVSPDTVRVLADALLENPRYAANTAWLSLHHQLIASIARQNGRFEDTIRELKQAMEYESSAELNMMMVTTYVDAGEFGAAQSYIASARRNAPISPARRYTWVTGLDELQTYVDHLAALPGREAAGTGER